MKMTLYLLYTHKSLQTIENIINEDLNITKKAVYNNLKINENKSAYMYFRQKKLPKYLQLNIINTPLTKVENTNLGLIINNTLTSECR